MPILVISVLQKPFPHANRDAEAFTVSVLLKKQTFVRKELVVILAWVV